MYVCTVRTYARTYVRTDICVYEVVCVLMKQLDMKQLPPPTSQPHFFARDLRLLSNSVVTCLCCGNLITDVVRIRGSKLSSWTRKVRSTSAAH